MYLIKKQIELTVIRNTLDTSEIENFYGSDLIEMLKSAFKSDCLPSSVEIYYQDFQHNVTPKSKQDVDKLLKLKGKFYAVVVPHGLDPISWLIIGVSVLVSVGVALLLPKLLAQDIANSGKQPPSPNNRLARRTNRERLGGRVPEIFGQVHATPDLIAPSYSVYIDHEQVEFSYLCLGRGEYEVSKVFDDKTNVAYIRGTTAQVFAPNKSFISDTPQLQVGNNYTNEEKSYSGYFAKRYSAVNGQVLPPPDNYVVGNNNIYFNNQMQIVCTSSDINLSNEFSVGATITIGGADGLASASNLTVDDDNDPNTPAVAVTYSLDGSYRIKAINANTITLDNPQAVNPNWQKLIDNQDDTIACNASLSTTANNLWTEWFYIENGFDNVMMNIIAPNGIYTTKKDGSAWCPLYVKLVWESEIIDDNDQAIAGTNEQFESTLYARHYQKHQDNWTTDNEVRRSANGTFFVSNSNHLLGKRLRVRFRRTSAKIDFDGQQNVDEVRIKDLYAVKKIDAESYNDDVTTVYLKQQATAGALSIKERKLNMLVTRKIKNASDPNGALIASKKAEDIIYHIATDEKIGNLTDKQIDREQIIAELALQRSYFNTDKCAQFCHTFDQNNISSEETLQTVAQAVFSQLYRYNNQLRLYFERPQPVGVAIFNSHNMLPNSYERSESFGVNREFDGVTVKYASPKDDAQVTAKTSETAINADEKTLVGVRNKKQAQVHLWRIWHKHLYSYKTVEFEGADESNIVIRSQRIEVADQLRANVMQGVVTDLTTVNNEIVMTLSEPISDDVTNSHTIFIQMTNGLVDSMQVTKKDEFTVILPRLPLHTISTSLENVVQATYQLVANNQSKKDAFIVTSKEPSEGIANRISAINYDERYYLKDK